MHFGKLSIASVWLVSTVGAFIFSSCTPRVTVGIEHAQTSSGYVNSGLRNEGTFVLVDLHGNGAIDLDELDLSPFARRAILSGELKKDSSFSNMSFAFSGPISAALKAKAEAAISKETFAVLEKFSTSRLRDPVHALNSPELVEWRRRMGDQYASTPELQARYRFLFVSGSVKADSASFGMGTAREGPGNKLVIEVEGQKFEVAYQGGKYSDWKGSQTPVLINVRVYRLDKEESGASGYRFSYETEKVVNVTERLNQLKGT